MMQFTKMIFLFVCTIFALSYAVTSERCFKLKDWEKLPDPFTGKCFSVINDDYFYCVEWDCPTPDCANPITPPKGCPYCRGTCVSAGKVYKWGEGFTCADGCNYCTCYGGSRMSTTSMMCPSMSKPPEQCKNV